MEKVDMKDVLKEIIEALAEGAKNVEIVGKLTPEEWAEVEAKDQELNAEKARLSGIIAAEYDKRKAEFIAGMKEFADDLEEKEMPALEEKAEQGIIRLTEIVKGHGFKLEDIKIDSDTGDIVQVVK